MKSAIAVSLALLILPLTCPVNAQTTSVPAATSSDVPADLLSQDKRLAVLVPGTAGLPPGEEKRVRIGRLLLQITKQTRVGLTADYENMSDVYIFAAFDTVKASDLLDGLAALWLTRWEVESPNSYRIIGPTNELDNAHLPKDENYREKYTAGTEFMQGIADLAKQGIGGDVLAGKTVNVSDLPPALQQTLARVITASDKIFAKDGIEDTFPLQDLALATFSVDTKPYKKDGFTSWFIKVGTKDWGQMGTRVTDYEQQKKKRGNVNTDDTIYTPVKFALPQSKARTLPTLRRAVRLNLPNTTVAEALQALHERYGLAIIADIPNARDSRPKGIASPVVPRADLAISAETVAEAFDALAEAFPGSQWEYRPSKFFLFRTAGNSAVTARN